MLTVYDPQENKNYLSLCNLKDFKSGWHLAFHLLSRPHLIELPWSSMHWQAFQIVSWCIRAQLIWPKQFKCIVVFLVHQRMTSGHCSLWGRMHLKNTCVRTWSASVSRQSTASSSRTSFSAISRVRKVWMQLTGICGTSDEVSSSCPSSILPLQALSSTPE